MKKKTPSPEKKQFIFFKTAKQNMQKALGLALNFNLIIEVIIGLVFVPISNLLIIYAIGGLNVEFLTDHDINALIDEPVAFVGLVAVFLFMILLSLYQITAMYTLSSNPAITTLSALFRISFKEYNHAFKKQNLFSACILVLLHPISNIVFMISIYYRFGFDRLLNLNVYEGIIVIVLVLFINSFIMFTYPIVFIEGVSLREAIKSGFLLVRKHWIRNSVYFILSILSSAFIALVIYLLFTILMTLITIEGVTSVGVYGTVLSILQILKSSIALITVVIFNIINSCVVASLYKLCKSEYQHQTPHIIMRERPNQRYWLISILLICILFAFSIFGPAYLRNTFTRYNVYFSQMNPEIIAHRGFSTVAPENTLAAVNAAIEANADRIEIDVRLTKDGQVCLMHDSSLLRTTGFDSKVSDLTYEEIEKLDAGSWFSQEYVGEKVPLLMDVLEECHGKIALKIELKPQSGEEFNLAELVVKEVQEADMAASVMLISFNRLAIKYVHDTDETIMTGLLAGVIYGDYGNIEYADAVILNHAHLTLERVNTIHRAGKLVYCWTTNTTKDIKEMNRIGVDGIITDYPIRARSAIYSEPYSVTFKNLLYKTITSLLDLFRS